MPDLVYLIAGDGDDRSRLESKTRALGLDSHVVFAGYITEEEKAAHYRLADAFVMPGHGEGFGIVYLEAMACGITVVASKADASREAVCNGELGIFVDPKNPEELRDGILNLLAQPRGRALWPKAIPRPMAFTICGTRPRLCCCAPASTRIASSASCATATCARRPESTAT